MRTPPINCVVIDGRDNVGVLVNHGGRRGELIVMPGLPKGIRLKSSVPQGHKVAVKEIRKNEPIIKFGQIIGVSSKNILAGEHVHLHNIKFSDTKAVFSKKPPSLSLKIDESLPQYFSGFLRKDGRAGIRNYIIISSTVNCSASVVKEIAGYFKNKDLSRQGIDGIVPVTITGGCAQAVSSYAYDVLNRTIAGWLCHPNVVGALVVGLGCETTTFESILRSLNGAETLNKKFLDHFNIQDVGGTKNSIRLGVKKIEQILSRLPLFKRTKLPISQLTLALNCGGSDAYSALTANPALGVASDILVSSGGTVAFAEIPECYGAEKLLLRRCLDSGDRNKLARIFSWWKEYATKNNISMNDNISLGNIAGGISTISEKTFGALAKGGSSKVNQVVDYAERINSNKKGLVLMNTPGFDPVSVTGLVAGGCNIVAFTTGRGSVYGCSIAPTIKIATNSELYRRLNKDIDINAGEVLTKSSIYEMGKKIYKFIIKVANGQTTCSEKNGIGKEEFIPWQVGVTL